MEPILKAILDVITVLHDLPFDKAKDLPDKEREEVLTKIKDCFSQFLEKSNEAFKAAGHENKFNGGNGLRTSCLLITMCFCTWKEMDYEGDHAHDKMYDKETDKSSPTVDLLKGSILSSLLREAVRQAEEFETEARYDIDDIREFANGLFTFMDLFTLASKSNKFKPTYKDELAELGTLLGLNDAIKRLGLECTAMDIIVVHGLLLQSLHIANNWFNFKGKSMVVWVASNTVGSYTGIVNGRVTKFAQYFETPHSEVLSSWLKNRLQYPLPKLEEISAVIAKIFRRALEGYTHLPSGLPIQIPQESQIAERFAGALKMTPKEWAEEKQRLAELLELAKEKFDEFHMVSDEVSLECGKEVSLGDTIAVVREKYSQGHALVVEHVKKKNSRDSKKGIEIYAGCLHRYLTNQEGFSSLTTLARTICADLQASDLDGEQRHADVLSWLEENCTHAHVVRPLRRYESLPVLCVKVMPFIDNSSLSALASTICAELQASDLDGERGNAAVQIWLQTHSNDSQVVGLLRRYQTLPVLCAKLMPFIKNQKSHQERFGSLSTLASVVQRSISASSRYRGLTLVGEQMQTAVLRWLEGNTRHAQVVGPLSRFKTTSALVLKLIPFIGNMIICTPPQKKKRSRTKKTWHERFEILKSIIRSDGRVDYSALDEGAAQSSMRDFVKTQRSDYRDRENNLKSPMTDERYQLLTEANFKFVVNRTKNK